LLQGSFIFLKQHPCLHLSEMYNIGRKRHFSAIIGEINLQAIAQTLLIRRCPNPIFTCL